MASSQPTEVLFYRLEHVPLERVLPELLEKTLARGWRAAVQASSQERIEAVDTLLWTYRDDAFLPHARAGEGNSERQPIYLTIQCDNPNNADVRFFIEGAEAEDLEDYARAVYLVDGYDEAMVARARAQWRAAREASHDVTYWQQNDRGKWEMKA